MKLNLSEVDVNKLSIGNNKILYDGESGYNFQTDNYWINEDSNFNKLYIKINKDDKLFKVLKKIDKLVSKTLNKDEKHSKLLKIKDDVAFLNPKISSGCLIFNKNKEQVDFKNIKNFNCKFIFNFGKISVFKKYKVCKIYIQQILLKEKEQKNNFESFVFDSE